MIRCRVLLPLLALVAALAACGADEGPVQSARSPDLHRPANREERDLARRYVAFATALAHENAERVCGALSRRLARAYRCGSSLRLPRALRNLSIDRTEIFAVTDPSVPDTTQISSPASGHPGALIVFFTRRADGWRVTRVMLGGYD